MNKLRLGIFPNMKKENVKNSLPKVLDLCDKAEIEAVLPSVWIIRTGPATTFATGQA